MIPPLHQRDAQRGQIFQQHIPHTVQFPPGSRFVAGQAGAQLLLHKIIGLIEAGADLRIRRKARPGAGRPQRAEQILPQAGQQHPLTAQLCQRDALLIPERVPPGHQQAGRVCPQGGAGQHRRSAAQIDDQTCVQLPLLHIVRHRIVVHHAEAHLHMGVLLAELVQLGLQPGQIVRHQRHADADAHRLYRLDLGPQGCLHLLELLHHRRGMALQAHAAVGKGELVVGAEEQRPAQLGFQRRDALPQCLPRQKQPLCRAAVIHFIAQYQKVVQLADIHGFLPEKSVIYKRIPPFCAIVKPLAAKNCRTALHRAAVRARNDQIRLRASSSPTSVKSGCICRMLAGTSGVTGPKNAFLMISALPAPFATMSTLRACMMVLMPMV